MSGKWTPGPWKDGPPAWYRGRKSNEDGKRPINSTTVAQPVIANVYGAENARLIAAAPELAEALEAMVERFGHDIFTMPQADRDLLTRAVAVLAKAKGEGA